MSASIPRATINAVIAKITKKRNSLQTSKPQLTNNEKEVIIINILSNNGLKKELNAYLTAKLRLQAAITVVNESIDALGKGIEAKFGDNIYFQPTAKDLVDMFTPGPYKHNPGKILPGFSDLEQEALSLDPNYTEYVRLSNLLDDVEINLTLATSTEEARKALQAILDSI